MGVIPSDGAIRRVVDVFSKPDIVNQVDALTQSALKDT